MTYKKLYEMLSLISKIKVIRAVGPIHLQIIWRHSGAPVGRMGKLDNIVQWRKKKKNLVRLASTLFINSAKLYYRTEGNAGHQQYP